MNKRIVNSELAPAPIGPYNQAVACGDMLFVSGQIALDSKSGEMMQENIEVETTKVMQNLAAVLAEANIGFEHVLKCSIFLSDMSHYGTVNIVYSKYFVVNAPAREAVAVKGLPKGANVEISLIASLK